MSSDEEDGEELNRSLEGFVVNNTHCSQGLNGGSKQDGTFARGTIVLTLCPPVLQIQRCTVFI